MYYVKHTKLWIRQNKGLVIQSVDYDVLVK